VDAYLAEIRIFPYSFVPAGWLACDGQLLAISAYPLLYAVVGTRYGGDGVTTFALPDLRGRSVVHPGNDVAEGSSGGTTTHALTSAELPSHAHAARASSAAADTAEPGAASFATTEQPHYGAAPQVALAPGAVASQGNGQPHDNMPPYLATTYAICVDGLDPRGSAAEAAPVIGEVRVFAGGFTPEGWARCDGQTLPIAQNQALSSLLGVTYGGNGQTQFAVPDLRGASPVHVGARYPLGQRGGAASVVLTSAQMPMHTHVLRAAAAGTGGTTGNPSGGVFAVAQRGRARELLYRSGGSTDVTMGGVVAPAGGGQAHPNRSPYLAMTMIIALTGIYPSRP
jgi:microcystin-dependent protein